MQRKRWQRVGESSILCNRAEPEAPVGIRGKGKEIPVTPQKAETVGKTLGQHGDFPVLPALCRPDEAVPEVGGPVREGVLSAEAALRSGFKISEAEQTVCRCGHFFCGKTGPAGIFLGKDRCNIIRRGSGGKPAGTLEAQKALSPEEEAGIVRRLGGDRNEGPGGPVLRLKISDEGPGPGSGLDDQQIRCCAFGIKAAALK